MTTQPPPSQLLTTNHQEKVYDDAAENLIVVASCGAGLVVLHWAVLRLWHSKRRHKETGEPLPLWEFLVFPRCVLMLTPSSRDGLARGRKGCACWCWEAREVHLVASCCTAQNFSQVTSQDALPAPLAT